MPMIELSRVYPTPTDDTYGALVAAVGVAAKLRSYDDFTRSVEFTTRMTGWASGANIAAQVVPSGKGSEIRFVGQAKMRTQINANNAAHKLCVEIFEAVSRYLQYGAPEPATGQREHGRQPPLTRPTGT